MRERASLWLWIAVFFAFVATSSLYIQARMVEVQIQLITLGEGPAENVDGEW